MLHFDDLEPAGAMPSRLCFLSRLSRAWCKVEAYFASTSRTKVPSMLAKL